MGCFGLNYQNHHHKGINKKFLSTFEKSNEGGIVRIVYIKLNLTCTQLRAALFRAILGIFRETEFRLELLVPMLPDQVLNYDSHSLRNITFNFLSS